MFDLVSLIKTIGYAGVFAIVFAESGLLIGFFLPGDSLIFTAGFLASQGFLEIIPLAIGVFLCAVFGDSVGYAMGKKVGPAIFKREDSIFFHKMNLERARIFYEEHGGKTIILARFLPIIRTFAPILAGVGKMKYTKFLFYNVIGGLIWGVGMTLLGYYIGNVIPNADKYIVPIVLAIIIISVLPSFYQILKIKESRERVFLYFRKIIGRFGIAKIMIALIFLAACVVAAAIYLRAYFEQKSLQEQISRDNKEGFTDTRPSVCFQKKCFDVEISDSEEERALGLMYREKLGKNKGMLFVFPEEENLSFWMRNTFIPLDMIWMDKDRAVIAITKDAEPCYQDPCPILNPGRPAQYVLEVNAGVSDKIGIQLLDKAEIWLGENT